MKRFVLAILGASLYQLAFNPLLQAALLLLWHWQTALAWAGLYLVLCAAAVAFGVRRDSVLQPWVRIWTAPDALAVFGNEQEGFDPDWYQAKHPTWPAWLRAFVFTAWRNKMRNLPFIPALAWLHQPKGLLTFDVLTIGGVSVEVWRNGCFTEIRAVKGRWFLDIGPRLDQPSAWRGVSWAFRLGRW